MNIFLDVSLIALILITVIVCWYRGFIRTVFGALKTVFAAILTYIFAPRVCAYLLQVVFGSRVTDFVYARLTAMVAEGAETLNLAQVIAEIPESAKALLTNFNVDLDALVEKYGSVGGAGSEELMELATSISAPVASFLSNAIGYALTFAVASILLSIVAWALSKVADLPIIKKCDRLLGLLIGILGAVFYSALYVLIVYTLLGWLEAAYGNVPFSAGFDKTVIFRPMYDYNIFRFIFGF